MITHKVPLRNIIESKANSPLCGSVLLLSAEFVLVIKHEVECLVRGVGLRAAIMRRALVADRHVADEVVERPIKNRGGDEAQVPRPWRERGADHEDDDPDFLAEIALNVKIGAAAA